MNAVSPLLSASASKLSSRARKYQQLFLQELAAKGQEPIAQAIGIHESTISRLKEHLPNLCAVMDHIGLKLVSQTMKCYLPADIDPIIHLARKYFDHVKSARDIEFVDDE